MPSPRRAIPVPLPRILHDAADHQPIRYLRVTQGDQFQRRRVRPPLAGQRCRSRPMSARGRLTTIAVPIANTIAARPPMITNRRPQGEDGSGSANRFETPLTAGRISRSSTSSTTGRVEANSTGAAVNRGAAACGCGDFAPVVARPRLPARSTRRPVPRDRARSCRSNITTTTAMMAVIASATAVTAMRMVSISATSYQLPAPNGLAGSWKRTSSQFEFHRDFNHHVDRRAEPFCRREPPLFHGFDRPLVETAAQTVKDPHVPHVPSARTTISRSTSPDSPRRRASSV